MVASLTQRPEFRNFLRGVLVIIAGALMILPAYLNYEIFGRPNFQLVASMSISLMLFSIGIVMFILILGKGAFEPKEETQ